ncbi:F-box DNA helicase 1-like [Saccostrea echinata]|uniref:F-box DNA helicase 1-like n=1 Tax=Saccostrea echinata TaxID=191078 RepID=UPI002A8313F8|nr:F-box DNA helicase 1-like [Saccostrea echinata]
MEEMNSSDDDVLCTAEVDTDSKFGLLGYQPAEKINYFEKLPDELLQKIFCQLPILDLCLNCNRVCVRWNQVISQEKFMRWKKIYYKLKKDNQNSHESKHAIRTIMRENGMVNTSEYLTGLIRYFKSFYSFPMSVYRDIVEKLEAHKKYTWAKALLEERMPELIIDRVPNPWSMIVTLVVISETVGDVQEVISCMARSTCLTEDILEMLYCCASILLVMKFLKRKAVWNGMHYRLFYALYLFENTSVSYCGDLRPAVRGGQQSIMTYSRADTVVKLTHEQLRIVNHNVLPGEVIKIMAFAGTGKTSTLVRYTQLRPNIKFLLVVYNRSVCDHAKTIFPKNVECQTGHSLAFKAVGRKYKDANKLRDLSVYAITQILPSRKGDNLFIRAKLVQDTLKTFFSSADQNISLEHVPTYSTNDKGGRIIIDPDKRQGYVNDAKYLWERMKDLRNKEVPMPHDGYLKLYQLYRPQLRNYNCILIDEAQDLTPALSDLLLGQQQAKILVGDPHQQIYSFRGAVNALHRISASVIFYLTQSFRFGPEIAEVAACCIEELKHEKKTLVGNGTPCNVYGEVSGQIAVLCRCNFTVFSEAVKKCCYAGETNIKVAFVGGTDGFGFPMLQDLYTLMLSPEERAKQNRVIENKLVKKFSSFAEFEQFATKTNDVELLGKIRIVKTYHHNLPVTIRKILAHTVRDLNIADMIFSTVHKAKGLEFNTVRLTDDFNVGQDVPGIIRTVPVSADEYNLLYVAVSRAKRSLLMTPTLVDLMKKAGERYEFPVLSSHLANSGVVMKCKETDEEFSPFALTLQKKTIVTSDGEVLEGGLYGPKILKEESHQFSELLGDPNHQETQAEEVSFENGELGIIIDIEDYL